MNFSTISSLTKPLAAVSVLAGLLTASAGVQAQSFTEGFNDAALPAGWVATNLSTRNSTGNPWATGSGITDADGNVVVSPFEGAGMALANCTSIGSGTGTINNWLISPLINGIQNGDTFSFWTTTTPEAAYPDRMEFRMATDGSTTVGTTVTSVGSFTTLLTSINSGLAVGGYPEAWTQYTVTVSGLAAPVNGRVAFRYFVTSGGPTGANSNIVGVDSFAYNAVTAVPEASTFGYAAFGALMLAGVSLRRRRQNNG